MFKKILNLFRRKVNIKSLGLIEDPRTVEEKEKDYTSDEITFSHSPVIWKEKSEAEWRKYPVFDQAKSSSCVGQAVAKCLGIENFIEEDKFVQFSARDIYTRRANRPGEGMWFQNAMEIGAKIGITFEQLMPSQGLNEIEMNKTSDRTKLTEIAGKIGRGGNYVCLRTNIDDIAFLIESEGRGVVLGVRFGSGEWNKDVPVVKDIKPSYGHGIVATNAILHKGKKALVIEDSWGTTSGKNGRRILTKDWFDAKRIVYAAYYKSFDNSGIPYNEKPQHNFKKDLYYGLNKDTEVAQLQKCLAYLKLFPSNVDFTGNFYSITLKAVKHFQRDNNIKPVLGYCGPLTRAKLNDIFK